MHNLLFDWPGEGLSKVFMLNKGKLAGHDLHKAGCRDQNIGQPVETRFYFGHTNTRR